VARGRGSATPYTTQTPDIVTHRTCGRKIVWTSKPPYYVLGLRFGQMKLIDSDFGGVLSGPQNGRFAKKYKFCLDCATASPLIIRGPHGGHGSQASSPRVGRPLFQFQGVKLLISRDAESIYVF